MIYRSNVKYTILFTIGDIIYCDWNIIFLYESYIKVTFIKCLFDYVKLVCY